MPLWQRISHCYYTCQKEITCGVMVFFFLFLFSLLFFHGEMWDRGRLGCCGDCVDTTFSTLHFSLSWKWGLINYGIVIEVTVVICFLLSMIGPLLTTWQAGFQFSFLIIQWPISFNSLFYYYILVISWPRVNESNWGSAYLQAGTNTRQHMHILLFLVY